MPAQHDAVNSVAIVDINEADLRQAGQDPRLAPHGHDAGIGTEKLGDSDRAGPKCLIRASGQHRPARASSRCMRKSGHIEGLRCIRTQQQPGARPVQLKNQPSSQSRSRARPFRR